MVSVRQIMHRRVARIRPDDSVAELIRLLARDRISGVPVVEPGCKLVGVVSVTDLLAALAEQLGPREQAAAPVSADAASMAESPGTADSLLLESAFMNRKVKDIMTPVAIAVHPDTPVSELAHTLRQRRMHRALVVDRGRLRGIVTAFDVLRAASP